MLARAVALSGLLMTAIITSAAPLSVNPDASGNKLGDFLETIGDKMPRMIRGLSNQDSKEFNALQFAAMLNESANIERKLDILISEMRKTNKLLAQKK